MPGHLEEGLQQSGVQFGQLVGVEFDQNQQEFEELLAHLPGGGGGGAREAGKGLAGPARASTPPPNHPPLPRAQPASARKGRKGVGPGRTPAGTAAPPE